MTKPARRGWSAMTIRFRGEKWARQIPFAKQRLLCNASGMPDPFDDIALTAAINILRDSIESGRMPSGLNLPGDAAELHGKAAEHLETTRSSLGQRFAPDPSGEGRDVQITTRLTLQEAWDLAQFLKRSQAHTFRALARSDEEAQRMQDAADRVVQALGEAGFAPR